MCLLFSPVACENVSGGSFGLGTEAVPLGGGAVHSEGSG